MKLREAGTIIVAILVLMGVIVVGTTATGKSDDLCAALGGKYTPQAQQAATPPTAANVCPGGSWRNLFGK